MTAIHFETFLVLVAAAVVAVPAAQRAGLGSVLGYLVAGAAVGPWGVGFVTEIGEIGHLAELGVVFLMFLIGMELNPKRLWLMRREALGLGSVQVAVTSLVFAAVAMLLGFGGEAAALIGAGLALSSTALVVKILSERGMLPTRVGRTSFAILLLQDVAVVPLLAFVSVAGAGGSLAEELWALGIRTVAIVAAVGVGGWLVLRPILRTVAAARTPEVFAGAAVLLVLGTAWLATHAGLPMELGAFIAGLVLSESEFRHQIEADIQPFRGFLLGLFFMTVGMTIDFGLVAAQGGTVAAIVTGVLAVKALCLYPALRAFGTSAADAVRVALLLSQGGEFAFVLFGLAAAIGVLAAAERDVLVLAVALTMAVTPLLAMLGDHSARRSARRTRDIRHAEHGAAARPVLVAGFGRVGRTVATMLAARDIPYVCLDRDAERVEQGRRDGYHVYFGDAGHPEVLRAAGAAAARLTVITLDEPAAAERALWVLRQVNPTAPIVARARDEAHARSLREAGATMVVLDTLEASLQLAARVLRDVGIDEKSVASLIESFREEGYRHVPAQDPDRRAGRDAAPTPHSG